MKPVAVFVGIFVALMGLDWIVQGNDFFMYKFFAPKFEDARRETYTHTRSYRNGSVQRLDTLCLQVADADDAHRGLINDVIAQEFVDWDMADVPAHLQGCLSSARHH